MIEVDGHRDRDCFSYSELDSERRDIGIPRVGKFLSNFFHLPPKRLESSHTHLISAFIIIYYSYS